MGSFNRLFKILVIKGVRISNIIYGTIIIDAGQSWRWRGWKRFSSDDYNTAERTFKISADKVYHLRWTHKNGFKINDLEASTYNEQNLSETDTVFDTTYDDMLIARIVSDAANKLTITKLANKTRLYDTTIKEINGDLRDSLEIQQGFLDSSFNGNSGTRGVNIQTALNWARTPTLTMREWAYQINGHDQDEACFTKQVDRY